MAAASNGVGDQYVAWEEAIPFDGDDTEMAEGIGGSGNVIERAIAIGKLMPERTLTRHGQYEGIDYWHKYADLFDQAFKMLPKKHPQLYK